MRIRKLKNIAFASFFIGLLTLTTIGVNEAIYTYQKKEITRLVKETSHAIGAGANKQKAIEKLYDQIVFLGHSKPNIRFSGEEKLKEVSMIYVEIKNKQTKLDTYLKLKKRSTIIEYQYVYSKHTREE